MRESILFGLAIGISPLPVLTMLLVLGSPRPKANGFAFWLAWVAGVSIPTVALVVAVDRSGATERGSRAIAVVELVVGVILFAIAAQLALRRTARSRAVPGWLEALDRSGPGRSAALALVLSLCNPKNLALMLAGAVAINETGNVALATGLFVCVAVFAVSAALAAYVARREAAQGPLAALRDAIARNDRLIGAVLGVVIGALFVLDGVRGL